MGKTACAFLICAAVVAGCGSGGVPSGHPVPTLSAVPCSYTADGVIGVQTTPPAGFRAVLKNIRVMTTSLEQAAPMPPGKWPYFSKTAMLIWAGTGPVSVSVPASWRGRAAISWGSFGQVETLTLGACASPGGVWDAFAGGLYLRTTKACVPVQFRLGGRTVTVTYGVGRECR